MLFSVDAAVRIEADDRAGRERLLRYCARPPFALERLRELDPERLLYVAVKPGPGGNSPLVLTPLELLDRLAALVPPPRIHRHRYYGVLAPHSPRRAAVTALAAPAANSAGPVAGPARRAARYAWTLLLARIDAVFPFRCPKCGGKMRIIAFITEAVTVRPILAHLRRAGGTAPDRPRPRPAAVGGRRSGANRRCPARDPSVDPLARTPNTQVRVIEMPIRDARFSSA